MDKIKRAARMDVPNPERKSVSARFTTALPGKIANTFPSADFSARDSNRRPRFSITA